MTFEELNEGNSLVKHHRPYQNTVARMKHEQEAKPKATVVDMPKR